MVFRAAMSVSTSHRKTVELTDFVSAGDSSSGQKRGDDRRRLGAARSVGMESVDAELMPVAVATARVLMDACYSLVSSSVIVFSSSASQETPSK